LASVLWLIFSTIIGVGYYIVFLVLINGVGFASAGTVLSCAGAPGKVLVPGGGKDDLLSSAEPAVDAPEQPEESKVPVPQLPDVNHVHEHLPNI
jgi:hypothetical protein